MYPRLALALPPLIVLAGCAARSPARKAAEERQTILSWTATAHMVGDAWRRRAVPTTYARQTLESARRAVGAVGKKDPALEETLARMADALRRNDRSALAQQIAALSEREQRLRAQSKPSRVQP